MAIFRVASDHFVATASIIALCDCGCGTLKIWGLDENDVARSLVSLTPEQLGNMVRQVAEGDPLAREDGERLQ